MLIGLLAAAVAAATAPPPVVIIHPHWLRHPNGDDIAVAYPLHAQRAEISGFGEMACEVKADGGLKLCRVFAEAPVGEGFGAAALSMAGKFRMTLPGQAAIVFLPIRFQMAVCRGSCSVVEAPKQAIVVSPLWAGAPTFADLGAAFPSSAKAAFGDVTLHCAVQAEGVLGACKVLGEKPAREGFAEAALSLTGHFRLDLRGRPPRPTDNLAVDINFHVTDPKSAEFQERRIGRPTWLSLPDPDQAAALFPAAAAAKGLKTGVGVVACDVAADGGLRNCVPRTGEPGGLGFSEAAAQIAPEMRMNPWTDAGGPVDGAQVVLPLRFDRPAATP